MKTILIALLLLSNSVIRISGQESKIKFGKISPDDLAMQVYAPDTQAAAVILSKIGRIKYDVLQESFALTEQVHIVTKILNASAIHDQANFEIDYYSHENHSKVGDIKGFVHLPDGTQIKIDNSHIFDFKANEYWSSKRIAFPKVVPGAILEIQYNKMSNEMHQPVDWFFQDEIPIVYTELTTQIPEWFQYVILNQGQPLDKNESKEKMETVSQNYMNRGESIRTSTIERAQANIKFINNTYVNTDVPALKEECCITSMHDYFSRIRYQLKAVQFPDEPIQPVLSSWLKLSEVLYDRQDWGGQFRNKRPGELVLESAGVIPSPSLSQIEIVQKVYDFVNNNIHFSDFYNIGLGKEISTILQEKSGHSGDLNKLVCAALIQSGIDAKPVLLSTRDHGKPLELYPFTDQFNHMVVLAKIDNKEIWIDVGDKNIPLGTLRPEALNNRGWVVDKTNPYWIDIKPYDTKSLYIVNGSITGEGFLNGTLESRFTGYEAIQYRDTLSSGKESLEGKILRNSAGRVYLEQMEWINVKDASIPLQLKSSIVNFPIANSTPDKLYIFPVYPDGLDELPFKLEDRMYPIEMNYPSEVSITLNLTIPEGYHVESIPEPVKYITENHGLQVIYSANHTDGKLNISMRYIVKQLYFDPLDYKNLKTLYDHRHAKCNEVIVLTKV